MANATLPSGILEVRNLVKVYPKVQAVRGVSFSIPAGICFGLLGPNGAGKTTTLEMIEGITQPTSGEILYQGAPVGPSFKEAVGIQFQSTALQDFLTVKEVLELFQKFYRRTADLESLKKLCSLEEFWDRDTHKLSGGQRQRVLLAVALVNNPDLVFLDEPTTGLDPQARRNFWDLVKKIKGEGKTIVLTTHYMEEAQELCDEIAIMDHGRIIAQGTPRELLDEHFQSVSIEMPQQDFHWKTESSEQAPFQWRVREGTVLISTKQVNETVKLLLDAQVPLGNMRIRSHTLEDLFLQLTGEGIRS